MIRNSNKILAMFALTMFFVSNANASKSPWHTIPVQDSHRSRLQDLSRKEDGILPHPGAQYLTKTGCIQFYHELKDGNPIPHTELEIRYRYHQLTGRDIEGHKGKTRSRRSFHGSKSTPKRGIVAQTQTFKKQNAKGSADHMPFKKSKR